jgi:hypothetical protein
VFKFVEDDNAAAHKPNARCAIPFDYPSNRTSDNQFAVWRPKLEFIVTTLSPSWQGQFPSFCKSFEGAFQDLISLVQPRELIVGNRGKRRQDFRHTARSQCQLPAEAICVWRGITEVIL